MLTWQYLRKLLSSCKFLNPLVLAGTLVISAWGQTTRQTGPTRGYVDLTAMDIADLMDLHVTTVSKQDQKLSQVAAAVFVIGQEDIRRSGANNIPVLLRMVPGMDIAQMNSNTWAISARGFNSQFANKLLVLVDGRAVYTPTFAEVFWDTLDVPLEDIERIEVIRGPGSTVWGNNAVNGFINIITKAAKDTKGGLLTAGGGTTDRGFGTVQYGGDAFGGATNYRVFTKYFDRNHFPDFNGQNARDDAHLLHGGFRVDSALGKSDSTSFQGDIYSGNEGESIVHSVLSPPQNVNLFVRGSLSGGDVQGTWNHSFSPRSDVTLQSYLDRYTRSGPESLEVRNTVDFDFRYHILLGSRNEITAGIGYRHSTGNTVGTIDQAFVPANTSNHLFDYYLEDQITLKPDRLFLYLGTKVEDNYFTGFDFEPSVRLAWTPTSRNTIWAAVTDAHRAPSFRDVGLDATLAALPGPAAVILRGNPNFQDEILVAYELGYRAQLSRRVSLDVATFINQYFALESIEPLPSVVDSSVSPPLLIIPKTFGNNLYGKTGGVETSLQWNPNVRWEINAGYSLLKMRLHLKPSSGDIGSPADIEQSNPSHQAQLRIHWDLPRGFSWDASSYFVSSLPMQSAATYTRLDSGLTWSAGERTQISVAAQNLLSDHHVEFNDDLAVVNGSAIKRSVYAKIVWKF